MLEIYVDSLALLAMIMGVFVSFANYPQTYEIVKRKSSKNVSLVTYLMLVPNSVIWVLYGLSLNNLPIIIANSLGLIGVLAVIIVYFKYK